MQDDIKLTRRLTINLGLRWDVLGPLDERYNRLNYGFFPNQLNPISSQINQTQFPGYKVNGGIGFTGVNGLPRTAFNTDWNNIQPRVGAAFQLTPTTVLREAAFGISYLPQVSFGNSFGFSQSTPYVASLDANQTPAGTVSNPFPSGTACGACRSRLRGLSTPWLGQAPNFFCRPERAASPTSIASLSAFRNSSVISSALRPRTLDREPTTLRSATLTTLFQARTWLSVM